jgi:hypothetical protein
MSNKCLICNEEIDMENDLVSMNYTKQERDAIYKKLINDRKKSKEVKLLGKKRTADVIAVKKIKI